jgi:aryl-alcohol dehydrogenase-like predicted oxidoreductase
MDYRRLGSWELEVPVLSFGTQARRLIDICLEAGVTLFDTADVYSDGASEEVLGAAIKGRRDKVLLSTKVSLPTGPGPNEAGSSRYRLIRSVEAALKRLGTDYIDLFQLHAYDARTPLHEVLSTLNDLVRDGKIRYLGASNFSGWQLMKSLNLAEQYGYPRHTVHQVYYSLIGRDYEWELMPVALDQGVGAMVWSPLGWGRLTGKIRPGQPLPEVSRLHQTAEYGPPVSDKILFRVLDALEELTHETGKTIPQIAINWLLQRPSVSTVVIGARNEEQLRQNLGAVGWSLTPEQMQRLDRASAVTPAYPYWPYYRQAGFARINPPPI